MVYAVILGLLFAILCVGSGVGIGIFCYQRADISIGDKSYRESEEEYKNRQIKGLLKVKKLNKLILVASILLVVFFALTLLLPASFRTVNTGEIAVVKRLGKAIDIRTAGTYFDFWMVKSYQRYDVKVQDLEVTTFAYSKDAQTMDIQMTVQYQIKADKVITIAEKYGELSILENRIASVSTERAKSTLSKYSAMELIETRENISPEVERVIKGAIDENYYVDVVAVVLTNIDFSDAFEATVEEKMIAEQKKLQAEYEKERAIIEAEKELEVAKLSAQASLAKAQGSADAQRVIADAEAYAAQVKIVELARTLGYEVTETETENGTQYVIDWNDDENGKNAILKYIQYLEYLSAWNGKLPDVVSGDNLNIFVPTT